MIVSVPDHCLSFYFGIFGGIATLTGIFGGMPNIVGIFLG